MSWLLRTPATVARSSTRSARAVPAARNSASESSTRPHLRHRDCARPPQVAESRAKTTLFARDGAGPDRGATHASHGWPWMDTPGLRGAWIAQRNDRIQRFILGRAGFVQLDEIAEGDREALRGIERVVPERILETRDDEREAQRVEPTLQELEVIGERRELALLLPGDFLKKSGNSGSHRHGVDYLVGNCPCPRGHVLCYRPVVSGRTRLTTPRQSVYAERLTQ